MRGVMWVEEYTGAVLDIQKLFFYTFTVLVWFFPKERNKNKAAN